MAIGSSGWKARQERARMKNVNSKHERAAIREARKAHYAKQAEQAEQDKRDAEALQARIDEAVAKIKAGEPEAVTEPEPETSERDEIIAELDARGIRWHPRMKDETLKGLLDAEQDEPAAGEQGEEDGQP
jgi:hypothetical protein